LGLDYEPADGTQVSKVWWDGEKLMAKPIPLEDIYQPVQEPWNPSDTAHRPGGLPQDFTKHEVDLADAWSEWVCPASAQYFMKCCDCGLVHEMQFKVAKYSEGDECEFVADADLQAVFRARRTTPPAAQRPFVGLTDEAIWSEYQTLWPFHPAEEPRLAKDIAKFARAIEAKLKETAQRQWVGLTDEERAEIAGFAAISDWHDFEVIDAVEAKLKEKNT
jgi:hypothetical protein